jgi:hypothetical protein
MPYLHRSLITPSLDAEGVLTIRIDLIQVDENCNVLKDEAGRPIVSFSETFRHKLQTTTGYVSTIGFVEGVCELPAFLLDEQARRHFVVTAEMQAMQMAGKEAGLVTGPRPIAGASA